MKTLFVIDMQKDFLLNDGKLNLGHDTQELRERVSSFIKGFEGHVILTQDTHNKNSCEFAAFPKHCIIDTVGWELADEIFEAVKDRKPSVSQKDEEKGDDTCEVIFKASFGGMGLYWTLDKKVLSGEIHVTGVCGHICVHDIVASIVNYAKEKLNIIPNIIIHRDMIDDFDMEAQEFALKRLSTLYGAKIV